ncbi:HPr kinase [Ameyamaea chiangmaiensis NBRC 103196]|nr:HPr kinase/phosphatase C-terminal domain-containing protein [Ameyamaea chiangmaiensis]GBQ66713.1 HPr kinase [Ameyamaea chiangmaiensis NBRC 103196]
MTHHASCAARGGAGVLLCGPPGSGKSDLLLRLLDAGYELVADDRVILDGGRACAPEALAGILEIRGIGLVRRPFRPSARVALVVDCAPGHVGDRLPQPAARDARTDAPCLTLDPFHASAVARIGVVLDCLAGTCQPLAGLLGDAPDAHVRSPALSPACASAPAPLLDVSPNDV